MIVLFSWTDSCLLGVYVGHEMLLNSVHHVFSLLLSHVPEEGVSLKVVTHTLAEKQTTDSSPHGISTHHVTSESQNEHGL